MRVGRERAFLRRDRDKNRTRRKTVRLRQTRSSLPAGEVESQHMLP
ncbi:hypothetical protein KIL84_015840 [Mauremys mutica]|uniref:Uncharacterized protein n=1 Tax=Mauremys mutica TaxID=74926 RepID=A0A9D3WU44_9SAUR|nr:hypothetical protein KIL84_015840 [Mauremys mutica]